MIIDYLLIVGEELIRETTAVGFVSGCLIEYGEKASNLFLPPSGGYHCSSSFLNSWVSWIVLNVYEYYNYNRYGVGIGNTDGDDP